MTKKTTWQNVFRAAAITTALPMAMTSTALATETRVLTLQSLSGVQDEVDVYRYPGLLAKYQLALVELGTVDNKDVYGGAFADVGGFYLGATVSREGWLFTNHKLGNGISLFDRYQDAVLSTTNGGPYMESPKRPVELLAAFHVGGGSLGFRLATASYRDDKEQTAAGVTTKTKRSADQLEIGIGFHTNAAGSLDLALTADPISSQKRTDNASGVESSQEIKLGSSWQLAGRWLANESSSGAYAAANLVSRQYDVKAVTAGANHSSKFSDQNFSLEGGYAAIASSHNAKLFTGATLTSANSKGPSVTGTGGTAVASFLANDKKASLDALYLSGAMSGEADIVGGFGAMVGLNYILYGNVTEKDDTTNQNIKVEKTVDETADSALWSLGVYYRQDSLRVDASYSKDFLHNGPYFVSGNATTPMLARISASYRF